MNPLIRKFEKVTFCKKEGSVLFCRGVLFVMFSPGHCSPSTLPGYVFPLWPRAGLQSFHRHGFVFPGSVEVCGKLSLENRDPIEPKGSIEPFTIFESWDVKERVDDTQAMEWFIASGWLHRS